MNWLFDNPLANLPGPTFLILYAVVIVTALIIHKIVKSRIDFTAKMPLPPIPTEPDPFEIAFLRGGANELARSAIFALTQKNLLKITNSGNISWIERTEQIESVTLKPLERTVYEWFAQPRQPKEVFVKGGLTESLRPFTTTYEARLSSQQLLTNDEMKMRLRSWTYGLAIFILGLGGYKLVAAISNGYTNVFFLILFGVAGTIILSAISNLPRLSKLGENYLERLQMAFSRLSSMPKPQTITTNNNFSAVDPLLLTVGIFGTAALAGTAYDSYNQAFYKAQQNSAAGGASGCGSSCGTGSDCSSSSDSGSSDSGSSCGGGCGGCGGGGD